MPEENMSDFLRAIQELRSVPIPDYEERVQDICRDLHDETIENGGWPAEFFAQVLTLLRDSRFLSIRTSWNVLHFIKNNWNLISPQEAAALRGALVSSYGRFGDWMGSFLASEILGQFYPDEETLRIFVRLSKADPSPATELIPHGLETLTRSTQDETLRGLAIGELEKLRESDSEHVRREAQISLEKIKKSSG